MSNRTLPDRPDPGFLRKQAKELLRGWRAGDEEAVGRLRAVHPRTESTALERLRLTDAQLVLAREYGQPSWPRLVQEARYRRLIALARERREPEALHLLREQPALARHRADDGPGPLHWAAFKGLAELVEELLRAGADPDAEESKFGARPVGWANEAGFPDLADRLIAYGADVDLSRAAALGRLDRVRLLLDAGADLAADLDDDWSPLAQAAGWGHVEIVRCLLDAGAPVDGRSRDGVTALHAAVGWHGHPATAAVLLDAGARLDLVDARGRTAVDLAREQGDPEMIALLSGRAAEG